MLRLVKQFITDNARRLEAQLSDFENNVATETAAIRDAFQPALEQRTFTPVTPNTSNLIPGQVALCDCALASVAVTLAPSAGLAPGWLAIVKRSPTNSVVAFPSGISAPGIVRQINGSANKVYTAAGAYWVYFDGLNWWG